MAKKGRHPVIQQINIEKNQGEQTRTKLFTELESKLGIPIIAFFTSFKYPVRIEDADADMLEGILQETDLSEGLGLFISSPGGDALAAERIINVCRSYSKTRKYVAIVPGKAKSAATMICFGASKIIMGATSELGPIDPQVPIFEGDTLKTIASACNIVRSYENLFDRAVKAKGRLEPYIQQLNNYDEREIEGFRVQIALSEDIAVKYLKSGMMSSCPDAEIKKKIKMFLSPELTKTHGRPIYCDEAAKCGLVIDTLEVKDKSWELAYELYLRLNSFVSAKAAKCIESKEHSFVATIDSK